MKIEIYRCDANNEIRIKKKYSKNLYPKILAIRNTFINKSVKLYPWIPEEISIGIFLLKKNCILERFIFLPYFHSERDKDLLLYSFIRERNFRNYEKSTILARRFHHSFESSESVDSPASLITSLAIVALSPTLLQEISKAQSSPCILLNLQLVKTAHTSSPRPRKKFLTSTPTPPASSSPKIQQRGSNKSTKERWSVPWFTAAENLWSRSFRRVPPVWEFVRGRSKRRKRARGRKKEGKKKKRKWSKKAERERRDMEGYRGWKDSTWPTFINIAIVRAPRAVFFIPYLLSRVPASVYARSYILEARFATGWLLSSERERGGGGGWDRWARLTSETIPRHGGTSRFDARVRCRVKRIDRDTGKP